MFYCIFGLPHRLGVRHAIYTCTNRLIKAINLSIIPSNRNLVNECLQARSSGRWLTVAMRHPVKSPFWRRIETGQIQPNVVQTCTSRDAFCKRESQKVNFDIGNLILSSPGCIILPPDLVKQTHRAQVDSSSLNPPLDSTGIMLPGEPLHQQLAHAPTAVPHLHTFA